VRWIVATALLVALAGCGGRTTLSRQAYAAKLNAMCADFAAREKRIGEPATLADVAARGELIADAFDAAIRQPVQRLGRPAALSDVAKRLVTLTDEQSANLHSLAAAAHAGDAGKAAQLATQNAALNARATKLTKELGATSCSGPG
jgi:cell pole-organizing protein PopZ